MTKCPFSPACSWHIAGLWTAWTSVPSPLWLHHCGADVNSHLHLSPSQTCINRVMVFCCQVSSTRGAVTDEQAVN